MAPKLDEVTPYSTIRPLMGPLPSWVPEQDQERITAYAKYEDIYWNNPNAYKLVQRGSEENPIYVPNPRIIADSTAHYLLKGLRIAPASGSEGSALNKALTAFLRRERFYSRFHVAKHSGVVRGDYVLHLTADPNLPEGSRISLTSVDPSSYFPIFDEDDLDRRIGVHLVEQFLAEDNRYYIKKLTYRYLTIGQTRRVSREEGVWEVDDWGGPKAKKLKTLLPLDLLPEEITTLPVYHLKNVDWQGQPYGSSELRGFERVAAAVNQAISDEEVALALEGLGVYATDAGRPVNEEGDEVDWEIAPARVMEVPGGSFFRRVEGISTVTPMLDHANYLERSLFEASATFRAGQVDVQVAESGIALAIRFLPTLAKIEERDWSGLDTLSNLFYDWAFWHKEFEGEDFTGLEIVPTIGAKLPENRVEKLNELNNMIDRRIISRKYYRTKMREFGYDIPENMEEEILEELQQMQAVVAPQEPDEGESENEGDERGLPRKERRPDPNQSNNKNAPNESRGSEARKSA